MSNRYSEIKRVGSVIQIPCPERLLQCAGTWSVLALDLPRLTSAVLPTSDGEYASLKCLVACTAFSLRAASARLAARRRSAHGAPPLGRVALLGPSTRGAP